MCVSCAWGKPKHPHIAEFCENGAKATAWELTSFRVTPDFFREHTVTAFRGWKDHDLEQAGRLTHPLHYDAGQDKYVACSWQEAFDAIGAQLKTFDPTKVIFYASGRASLETSYMWALYARLYGSQNLPDSVQHVPRDDLGRAQVGDRLAGRDDPPRRLRPVRRDLLLRAEPGDEQPALPPSAAQLRQARRGDRRVQPAQGTRAGEVHRSAKPGGDGDHQVDADRHPVPPGQGGRRHRRDHGHGEVADRGRRRRSADPRP